MWRLILAGSETLTRAPGVLRPLAMENTAVNFGSLVLDSSGMVFKCSDAAARMFGGSVGDLEGSPIWTLIAGIMPSDTSPSFNARYLAHLSATTSRWCSFQAKNVAGLSFQIELAMSEINADDGASLFLIHLRQPTGA